MARRFSLLWLVLNALAFIFAGQTWWQLQVNSGDQITVLVGTGFDSDRSISAILMFTLAAWLFVAFSRGWAAVAISAAAGAATVLLAVTTAANFGSGNIGGISSAVEKHTGIAIDPILAENMADQVTGQLQVWALLTLITLVALAGIQAIFAVRYRSWMAKAQPRGDRTKPTGSYGSASKRTPAANLSPDDQTEPEKDTISLWDSQRD